MGPYKLYPPSPSLFYQRKHIENVSSPILESKKVFKNNYTLYTHQGKQSQPKNKQLALIGSKTTN